MSLYWLLRLPALHEVLNILSLIIGIPSLILCIFSFGIYLINLADGKSEENICMKLLWSAHAWSRWLLLVVAICALLSTLCPTRQDLALMLGWDAIKSDSVQEVIEILKDKIK